MARQARHRYRDPLDEIWIETARRIAGLAVERTSEAYASSDGRGGLALGTADTLDPDDCTAQMVLHELCHALVEGPGSLSLPDWGLGASDLAPTDEDEHACLRLQATLAARHGLRRVLAPTTEYRAFYDRLGAAPLARRELPSVRRAIAGLRRAARPPWAPHLDRALAATADISRATSALAAGPAAGRAPLLAEVQPAPPRHPSGVATRAPEPDGRTCGGCAWRYTGGRGRAVDRCRQGDGVRVSLAWPACERWEPELDCQQCGACCRAAYDSVTVPRADPVVRRHPHLVVHRDRYVEMLREGDRCAALAGGEVRDDGALEPYACRIYADRPRPCREFARGGEHCLTARRRTNLSL